MNNYCGVVKKDIIDDMLDLKNYQANILIIDDEDICLFSMEMLLFNTSYSLIKVNTGNAAIDYLKNHSDIIDLIFLDLMMPDMYGLELLDKIKQDPHFAKIPIILQTGTADIQEIQKAYSKGIFSYINKPYTKELILLEIRKALKFSPLYPHKH